MIEPGFPDQDEKSRRIGKELIALAIQMRDEGASDDEIKEAVWKRYEQLEEEL